MSSRQVERSGLWPAREDLIARLCALRSLPDEWWPDVYVDEFLCVPVEMDGPRFGAWDATQQLRRVKVFGLIYS
jgi:hypothetical protein